MQHWRSVPLALRSTVLKGWHEICRHGNLDTSAYHELQTSIMQYLACLVNNLTWNTNRCKSKALCIFTGCSGCLTTKKTYSHIRRPAHFTASCDLVLNWKLNGPNYLTVCKTTVMVTMQWYTQIMHTSKPMTLTQQRWTGNILCLCSGVLAGHLDPFKQDPCTVHQHRYQTNILSATTHKTKDLKIKLDVQAIQKSCCFCFKVNIFQHANFSFISQLSHTTCLSCIRQHNF
jgi:hypothetical protein